MCEFLGKPVPSRPFPRENVGGQKGNLLAQIYEFKTIAKRSREIKRSLMIAGTFIISSIGIGAIAYLRPNSLTKLLR